MGRHVFSCQSLLLSITVLNDERQLHLFLDLRYSGLEISEKPMISENIYF